MGIISEELRRGLSSPISILSKHTELIKNMYIEGLAKTLDNENESREENLQTICLSISLCLLHDLDSIEYPLPHDPEEEDLVIEVAESVRMILTLESLIDKGRISKSITNGIAYYKIINKE